MVERVMLLEGDVLEALKLMPPGSCDGLIADVPYGLGPKQPTGDELIAYLQGAEMDTAGDFMGKKWHVPSIAVWKEVFRVLKPGAPLLVNVAPRTQDLVSIGMRAAGFEVGDVIAWMFAEGMVKNHNLSKALDKAAGATREVIGTQTLTGNAGMSTAEKGGTYGVGVGTAPAKTIQITVPATPLAKAWAGHGTSLAPGYEPVIVGWKPNDGTYVENITKHGVGGLNIGDCRIEREGDYKEKCESVVGIPHTNGGVCYGDIEGVRENSHNTDGSWPKNLILSHLPECSETGCPPWCPAVMLDAQTGDRRSSLSGRDLPPGQHANPSSNNGASWFGAGASNVYADSGGASRFYYCAKSSKVERDLGCDGLPLHYPAETVKRKKDSVGINNGGRAGAGRTGEGVRNPHPNVKPIALCKYLATLELPPPRDGSPRRLLNIYSGSGSEAVGAVLAGWDEIVCVDKDPLYCTIARARTAHAIAHPGIWEAHLNGEIKRGPKADARQVSLFDAVPTPRADLTVPEPVMSAILQTVREPTPAPLPPPVIVSEQLPPPVIVERAPPPIASNDLGGEMPLSELAQKLCEKGWPSTIQEIASWEPAKRLRAAKYVLG